MLLSPVGAHAAFWIYGGFSALTLGFVFLLVPETRGKSLEQIEAEWRGEECNRDTQPGST
jgi:MFS transporter, SP family, arabinose:H+ symporter